MGIPNRGPELLAVNIAFVSTAVMACALRCFVRLKMVKAFGLDDYLMVLATLFFVGYTTSSCIGVHYGTGRHRIDLAPENYEKGRHAWFFCYLFFSVSMICSKMSIGYLLLRISIRRIHTWTIYSAMLVSIVAGGTFFFVCLFQCYPVSYMYAKDNRSGKCIDNTVITALGYVYSIFSIISDFTFAIIPGFLIWNLQLKRRAKIALIPLITMGCVASAAVIARLPFIRYFNSPDFLWATTDIAIWSTIEMGLAITAGSLATLRPLFFIVMSKLGITTRPSRSRPSAYGMSAPLPGNAASASGSKAEHFRPDMYKLSAHVQTRISEDEDIPQIDDFPRSPNWFNTSTQGGSKKSSHDTDNESQKSLRIKSARPSMEDANMHHGIMVSKSFYITDEERNSIMSRETRETQYQ
ncbi:hypothetical protein EJ02DRAFT_140905 [Clathrospora elynae]|uniref:Rhodopsin domain-containing protein n=1 Tax=Clathrospora elynae TaxID=706981 RepID=A0A6A5T9D7_9PLEO|nr:hypothetical protein EJ02DRAFT_140905 [Clathrospora elynae]